MTMYIPPNGIYFRLINRESQLAIYSNDNKTPNVSASPPTSSQDQLFTLIHGTGNRKGLFAIQGRISGKVLFSRTEGDPKVGHIAGNGNFDDNWFKFVEGTGPESASFRIVCPATNTEIYSSTRIDPPFGNLPLTEDVDDAAWNFAFEPLNVADVSLDVAAGRIDNAHTETLFKSETFVNDTDVTIRHTFVIKGSYKDTSLFAYTSGFPIPAGKQLETPIPVVSAAGKVELSPSPFITQFGIDSWTINNFHAEITVAVPPHKRAFARAVAEQGTVEVPFTITLVSPNGTKAETEGEWVGDVHWNVRFPVEIN